MLSLLVGGTIITVIVLAFAYENLVLIAIVVFFVGYVAGHWERKRS